MLDNPIEEIKSRLNIIDVLADYIQLKKAGTNYKAVCPFHSEKSPSLMVSTSKQIWHCFGCGLGGDIFEFIKQAENVEFAEALKILADRAGVELKKPTQQEIVISQKRHTLYDINAAAAKYFSKVLWESRAGNEALMYLRGRGLTDQTIKAWQLGFSPDDFHYAENFLTKTFPAEDVALAGIIVKRDRDEKNKNPNAKPEYFDRFRGRVMFPILNIHGQVVAFTARILKDDGKSAKYINSPETPVYNKSRELFGLFQAKNAIRKENRAILVEGNMDVITCHQAGFNQTVASSGTALGAQQLQTLQRFTENLIFAFDADSAGANATKRALEEALNLGLNVKIADMKGAKDPDELIRKGIGIWRKAVDTARNFAEYYFEKTLHEKDFSDVEAKRTAAKELAPLIMRMSDPVTRGHFVRKLSQGIDVAEQAIWDIINRLKQPRPQKPKNGLDKRKSRREVLEEQYLGLILITKNPAGLKDWTEDEFLEENREVVKFLKSAVSGSLQSTKNGELPVGKSNQSLAAKLELLMFAAQVEASEQNLNPEGELLRVKAELKKTMLKERMTILADQLKAADHAHDKELVAKLSEQFTKVSQEIGQYN